MSTILLEDAKRFLRLTHDQDDQLLQDLLNAAEDEACKFMDRLYLPLVDAEQLSDGASEIDPVSESESPSEASAEVAPAVRTAVFMLLKANYDGSQPDGVRGLSDLPEYRKRAEALLFPYRILLGV